MRIYTVHERPAPAGADPDAVLVKEGFCWPAFLLAPLWLLWHRQWLGLVFYLLGALLLALVGDYLDLAGDLALGLGYAVLSGASANDWRRARLAARGYALSEVVAAGSLAEAEIRLFHGRAAPPAAAAEAPRVAYRRRESAAPLAPWSP